MEALQLKIEKDVPIPESRWKNKEKGQSQYDIFNDMKPGDSVLFADKKQATLSAAMTKYHKENKMFGRRLTSRSMSGGVRIWRIK